jgi:integrase
VRAAQHVFRRGAVYWWRRRLLKKSGERELAPIAISLRTHELPIARTIAAHLSVASDGILRQEKSKVLSAFQVRSILESVARSQLSKLDRLSALETADGIASEEGRSSDRVMGWVRRLQASQGFAAAVGEAERRVLTENGLITSEIDDVAWTLDLLRSSSNGALPRQKLLALLEASGASQGEGDIREAERLYYRGQAAALLAVDRRWSGDFRDDDRLVEDVLARPEGRQFTAKGSLEALREPAATEFRHVEVPEVRQVAVVPAQASPLPVEGTVQGNTSTAPSETSITELAARLIGEKAKLGEWNEKTQRQVRSLIGTFVEMIESDDVRSLSQGRVAEYRSLLLSLPKTYGKGQNDRNIPLKEWLAKAKKLPKDKIGREAGTLNRHLTQLQEILDYIVACGHSIPGYAGVSELLAKKKGRDRDQRNPFSAEDLAAIFRQAPWTGCKDSENRIEAGSLVYHDALHVVPYLARYTFGRREELCGLDVDDVLEEDGIPYIFIRPNEHRTLKNPQSMRRVPLIGEVLRLGFLQYHSAIKKLGHKLLFPELRAASDRTPLGDTFYGDWIKVQNVAVPNAAEQKKVFHSFRKSGGADLKHADVASELRADILGHGGDNITEERYASSAKLKQMLEALQKLPIMTDHIHFEKVRLLEQVSRRQTRRSAQPRRRSLAKPE